MIDETVPSVSPEQLRCFVIGPIGDRLAPHGSEERLRYEEALEVYEEVILPACKAVGLQPVRADEISQAGDITTQVFRRLRDDDIVIADVSDGNPNVMYELGLRHTQDKLTVQIGEYGRLPFDILAIRTVRFSRSKRGLINAREELISLLRSGMAGDYELVAATRIWLPSDQDIVSDAPELERDQLVDSTESEEPGFLDLVAQMELATPTFTGTVEELSQIIEEIGALAIDATAKLEQNDASGGTISARLTIAINFAKALDAPADRLKALAQAYATNLGDIHSGMDALLAALEDDPKLLSEAGEFPATVRQLASTARESMQVLNQLSISIGESRKIAKAMRDPARKLMKALSVFTEASAVMDDWDRRLQVLGVPIPEPPEDGQHEDDA